MVFCFALLSCFAGNAFADGAERILVLGDSLTAGYGLPAEEAFPQQLQAALQAAGREVTVINAGVSGDTSAGGLARLDWLLGEPPDVAIIELGANDALRGLPPESTHANLEQIILRLQQIDVRVLLAGMRAPRNLGSEYYNRFDALYPRLAEQHDIPLFPFFLDGVAGNPDLNLADGIHPNARGIALIVANILPYLHPLLASEE